MLRTLVYFTAYTLCLFNAKPLTNHPPTSVLPSSTPPGCEYEGQFYSPGDSFDEGMDGEGWCFGLYCSEDGSIIPWDDHACETTTPPPIRTRPAPTISSRTTTLRLTTQRTRTPMPTTKPTRPTTIIARNTSPPKPRGCEYEGQNYALGENFDEGTDGKGWCFGLYCGYDGNVVPWDDFNCRPTTSPPPTTTPPSQNTASTTIPFSRRNTSPKTSTAKTTTPKITTPKTTTRKTTTPKSTTKQTSDSPTTIPLITIPPGSLRCEYEGQIYALGESFNEGTDGKRWCFGLYCGYDGNVVPWDDFNCGPTTSSPPMTTPPSQNTASTTIPFSRRNTSPKTSTAKTTTPKITTPKTTTRKTTTPKSTTKQTSDPPTTIPPITIPPGSLGCEYEGQIYALGESFNEGTDGKRWCFGLYCGYDGNVVPWDDFNCGPTTSPPPITTPPSQNTASTTIPFSRRNTSPKTSTAKTTTPKITTPKTTTRKTTTPKSTTKQTSNSPTTNPLITIPPGSQGCEYEGQIYALGESFNKGTTGEEWCFGLYCGYDGNVVPLEGFECGPTTSPPPTTTSLFLNTPYTTTPKYPTGFHTSPKTAAPTTLTKQTSNPPTITPQFTHSHTPTSEECEYKGQFYSPKEMIVESADEYGWCLATLCDYGGNLIPWEEFECEITTPPPPKSFTLLHTSPKTTITRPIGCEYEGKFYSPGKDIRKNRDDEGWCHGLYCSDDGYLVPWDDFNCEITNSPSPVTFPPTTTPPPTVTTLPPTTTTPPPTSTPDLISTPIGCIHEGRFYPPGEISRGTDGKNWCYGSYCDDDGLVVAWDNWNCGSTQPTTLPFVETATPSFPTTTEPTTNPTPLASIFTTEPRTKNPSRTTRNILATLLVPTTSLPASKKTSPPTTNSGTPTSRISTTMIDGMCFFEGKYFQNGDIISRIYHGWSWCYGWFCNEGKIERWNNFNCANPTTIPTDINQFKKSTPSTPSNLECYYKGAIYNEGDVVETDFGSGDCELSYCKGGVLVSYEGSGCGKVFHTKPPTAKTHPPTTKTYPPATKTHLLTTKTHPSNTESIALVTKINLSTKQTLLPTTKNISPTTLEQEITTPKAKAPFNTQQSVLTTQSPDSALCFHDGKYYEEGDIISRDFDGENWCSGWHCKGGNMIRMDCDDITEPTSKEITPSPEPQKVISPEILGPKPSRCFHESRYYEEGDLASNDFDGDDWCSGLLCKGGEMVQWDNCGLEEVKTQSTLPSQVTQAPDATQVPKSTLKASKSTAGTYTTTESSSKDITKTSGTDTSKSPDVTTSTTARSPDTTARSLDTPTSKHYTPPKTSHIPTKHPDTETRTSNTTANVPDTTTKAADTTVRTPAQTNRPEKLTCYYKGLLYPPGEVTKGTLNDGRCYGVICDISGVIVQWVTATCAPTEPPTAAIKATLPGCLNGDKYFPPGRISRISDGSNWCLDVICTEEGKITSLHNWNCNEKTTMAPTTASVQSGTTCLYNGIRYYPGVISEGVDADGWCYKVVCQMSGQLYLWGDWHCKTKTPTPTPLATTQSAATNICSYNGKSYPVGDITRGEDATGWCYGVTCRHDGQVVLWGSFKCAKV